jgi:Fe-S cluster assembly protein SufD
MTGSGPRPRSERVTSRHSLTATDATRRYVAEFEAFAANGAGKAPQWLRELRAAAIARFAELGFPTTRQEDWRFTSVAPIAETPFALPARRSGPATKKVGLWLLPVASACRLVFVNGRFSAPLSSVEGLPRGVRAASLAAALDAEPELVQRHLVRAGDADTAFGALNTAFIRDGAFVHVAAGVELDAPLQLLFLTAPGAKPMVSHPRNLVVVERGARASVIEGYAALQDGVYWTNAVTQVHVGEGAHLELVRCQREAAGAYHVAITTTRQERNSVLRLHPMVLGAALARHDITSVLDGPGAELVLNGLYLLGGRQHADHHTVIDHAKPDCQSHEFFNGVLDGGARGVFNGRIIVRPGAQRTDSKQTNHNLVLSEQARADSQPQLEIYADDVKCTHGATLGPLDPKALFYLQSRGLSLAEARSLLTYGFGAEILGRVRHAGVRDALDTLVRAALAAEAPAATPSSRGATL